MLLRAFLILLAIICQLPDVEASAELQTKKYPCDGSQILIAYDISDSLSAANFKKEIKFLVNHVFGTRWTHVDNLAILYYGNKDASFLTFSESEDVSEVDLMIRYSDQSHAEASICRAFKEAVEFYSLFATDHAIFFVSTLDIYSYQCLSDIQRIKDNRWVMTFVTMGMEETDITTLKGHFPGATILRWDIDYEQTPSGWNQQFWTSYGCNGPSPDEPTEAPQKTTTPLSKGGFDDSDLKNNTDTGMYLAIFIPIGIILLIALVLGLSTLIFGCWFCRCRNRTTPGKVLTTPIVQQFPGQPVPTVSQNSNFGPAGNFYTQRSRDPWEIMPNNLTIDYNQKLGAGAFADVYHGRVIGDAAIKRVYPGSPALAHFHDCEVAVKMMRPPVSEMAKNDFNQELEFMKSLNHHAHLVVLLGYVSEATNLTLVLEYCNNGNLLNFIRSHKNEIIDRHNNPNALKLKHLLSFAWQICDGLDYLGSLGRVHRDVAARNILLDKDFVCKIGDFGLCRIVDNDIYLSRGGKIPVRWMSVESLRNFEYSSKSDVWSYAVLLYELFSFGSAPYAAMQNEEVLPFLESGERLQKPQHCTAEIYDLMQHCWAFSPEKRPSFNQISRYLAAILEHVDEEYGYVEVKNPMLVTEFDK